MKESAEYESKVGGLWGRFITKSIASFVLTYYASVFVFATFFTDLSGSFLLLFILIALAIVAWILFKEYPLKWKKRVTIDFQNELITIIDNKGLGDSSNVLDFNGNKYSFNEIDNYSVVHYESFLFNSYYLVKIFVKEKEIKLLSFKDATRFTEFIGILNNQLKLKNKS